MSHNPRLRELNGQNTSFDTMSKIAFALGKKLKVEFT